MSDRFEAKEDIPHAVIDDTKTGRRYYDDDMWYLADFLNSLDDDIQHWKLGFFTMIHEYDEMNEMIEEFGEKHYHDMTEEQQKDFNKLIKEIIFNDTKAKLIKETKEGD